MAIKVCVTQEDGVEICTTISVGGDAASSAYAATVGDGTSLSFTLEHGLGTRDLSVIFRDAFTGIVSGNAAVVTTLADDSARLDFSTAPTTGQYVVTLLAVVPTED